MWQVLPVGVPQRHSEERKAEVLRAYREHSSLRGLSRTLRDHAHDHHAVAKKNS